MDTAKIDLTWSRRGSFTIEASIVFSVVFLLIAVLVYLFIIMYQYSSLQSTANAGATMGSYYYVNKSAADYTKSTGAGLYWRIIDNASENKKAYIREYIEKSARPSILRPTQEIKVETGYNLLIHQLKVEIKEQYLLPVGNVFNIFGIYPTLELRAESMAPLEDKPEFVRNLDTVIDIKNCLANSDNKWIGSGSKVNEIMDKLIKKH